MTIVDRIALCDVDAVIVRESVDGGAWHTVTSRMTVEEALQLASELTQAAKYLRAKETNPQTHRRRHA